MYNILITRKFGVPRLIMIYLDKTQSKARIRDYLSTSFCFENGLKQIDALSPLLFRFSLKYAIRKVQKTNLGLDMNGLHQVLAYTDDENDVSNLRVYEYFIIIDSIAENFFFNFPLLQKLNYYFMY